MSLKVEALTGKALLDAIPALAELRIRVFRDWPYLYDGDLAYEEKYLARFVKAERAFLAVAKDEGKIVGASTAAPLETEVSEFKEPVINAGYKASRTFYFAESILLPQYRGQGIGKQFFDLREAHAEAYETYTHAVFCGVVRDDNHPAKPSDYEPLDIFWRNRGFEKLNGVTTSFSWKDQGDQQETAKTMQFWGKEI